MEFLGGALPNVMFIIGILAIGLGNWGLSSSLLR